MRLYYNSATPPAETWVRVSAIVAFPEVITRLNMYGLCIVTLRDFQGTLFPTWNSRDLIEMKVTDDAGTPNTLFRGFLINKKFHDRDVILEIAGLGLKLYRRSFGSEEIMNYALATGYPKTLNANTQIDLQYKDSDGVFNNFGWAIDKWIDGDKDVAIIIKDNTSGFSQPEWDSSALTVAGGTAMAGNNASTITFDDSDYYQYRESGTPADATVELTIDGALIAQTQKLKEISIEYSFRAKITGRNTANIIFEISKDGSWIEIDRVACANTQVYNNFLTDWVQALPDDLKEGSTPHLITEEGVDTELQKYFNAAGGNYTELEGLRFRIEGAIQIDWVELQIDYMKVTIKHHDDDVLPIMAPITDSGASWVKCATIPNWQEKGITVDVDAFQIAENTGKVLSDIFNQAGLNFEIIEPTHFTKYLARKYKGKHCIEPLKAVMVLEGAEWLEDHINNQILIIKKADFVDSGISLTQADYEHEWEYEDQCNQVKYIYVWGRTSINEVTQTTVNIFAKAISETAEGHNSKQIIDDNIMTLPEAQAIADAQRDLLESKRPSIRVPIDGVNIALQLGTYVNLTMARPTVVATDYNMRMIHRFKRGKTGIKTVIYCGMGETDWDEKLIKQIQKLDLETHKALTDRLESTPYDIGVGGIVWEDIGGRESGAVAAVNAAGLSLAATKVITSADADLTFIFGRAQIDSRFGDMMIISHRDMSTQDQYAFGQLNNGNTYINAPTGKLVYFNNNDVQKMSMSASSLGMSVPIGMGTNKITGLGDPTNAQDAATKAYVDTKAEDIIYPTSMNGSAGFALSTWYGSCWAVIYSDVNAVISAAFFVKNGGSFKLRIIHDGSAANAGKTAAGNISISYDIDNGTETWNIGPIAFNLALANASILLLDDYGTPFTVADNSKVGMAWIKTDNAGGAIGPMQVYGIVLVRQ